MDPSNPIVLLCAEGMSAEGQGRRDAAKALFERAWSESRDDYEACIAAHYLARHQPSLEAELDWNAEALRRAEAVADGRVRDFYPSLYLNYAHSLERTGRISEARDHYERAAERLADLPDSPYAQLVRLGVTAGRKRVRDARPD